jgi:hypothetical protein
MIADVNPFAVRMVALLATVEPLDKRAELLAVARELVEDAIECIRAQPDPEALAIVRYLLELLELHERETETALRERSRR